MNEIKGISCEAKNCKYHDTSDCCNAGQIKVGSQSATETHETACQTFICDESCDQQ